MKAIMVTDPRDFNWSSGQEGRCRSPTGAAERFAYVVIHILALLTVTACATNPVPCEGPTPGRIPTAIISLGVSEWERAVACPNAVELYNLKVGAKTGNPRAQYELSEFYRRSSMYGSGAKFREIARQSAMKLAQCGAEGGSLKAQHQLIFYYSFWSDTSPDAAKAAYKFSRVSEQREGCDCKTYHLFTCFMCRPLTKAKEYLSVAEIAKIEREISAYEPTPTPCELEALTE